MKKNIITTLIFVFGLFLTFFLFSKQLKKNNEDKENIYVNSQNEIKFITFHLNDLKKRRLVEISHNGRHLNSMSLINIRGSEIRLKEVVDKNKLVFYYNSRACSTCLEEEVKRLKQKQEIDPENILIITDFENLTDFYRLIRILPKDFTILNSISPLNLMQDNSLPIYFILDRYLVIKKLFIPDQDEGIQTDRYLDIIKTSLD